MIRKTLSFLSLGLLAFSVQQAQAASIDFSTQPQQGYTQIGSADLPTNAYILWHYAGGYWKANDLVIQDSDMAGLTSKELSSGQLNITLNASVDLPQSVIDFLNKTGKQPSDLQLVFSTGNISADKIFKSASYQITNNKINVQFQPKFNVAGDFYWDPNMNVTVPRPSTGLGANDTSVWSIPSLPQKHYGANLYNSTYPITGDKIADSTGKLVPGTYSYTGGSPTETGDNIAPGTATDQEIRVGSDTFANGGAVGVEFWYPLSVKIYADNTPKPQPTQNTDNPLKFVLNKGNADVTLNPAMVGAKSGGNDLHSYEYNPELGVVWDGTYGHRGPLAHWDGVSDFNQYTKMTNTTDSTVDFDLHQYWMNYTTDTLTMENRSSDSFVFYIMENGKRVGRYELGAGEKKDVPIQLGDVVHFPTPLEDQGYWDKAELTYQGQPATIQNITPDQQADFDKLIDAAK